MFYQLLIFIIAAILTFLYGFLRKKISRNKDNQFLLKVRGYYLHHSLLGLALMISPLFNVNILLFYIGLGIVIGHGFEEVYFGSKNLKTFFTFISK
jgi:branched-subunit amino acid transport protein AzlD